MDSEGWHLRGYDSADDVFVALDGGRLNKTPQLSGRDLYIMRLEAGPIGDRGPEDDEEDDEQHEDDDYSPDSSDDIERLEGRALYAARLSKMMEHFNRLHERRMKLRSSRRMRRIEL